MVTLFNLLVAYDVRMSIETGPVRDTIIVYFIKDDVMTNVMFSLLELNTSLVPLEEVLCNHLKRFVRSLERS